MNMKLDTGSFLVRMDGYVGNAESLDTKFERIATKEKPQE